ncbi:MAG: cytochrome [Pseudooceanicola sp.]|jgi:cytochrome P450/ferredoxin-NADP reductase|nr:cytochrome [Pseudooceanicola sp.]
MSTPTPAACPAQSGTCPVSPRAQAFDPFVAPYQADPAAALAWARAEEPVFYSPDLGYWVVARYDDIKAVFRDNLTFSPANVLEKITPFSDEATQVLASYNYAMNRTLVNEDEPAHMERRRVLLDHFLPANLAHHEDMVRRLVREKVDGFIATGRTDLVEQMLWEVPLTVALHFLGVPEEDMDRLRAFSIAHTVNTWGRPSPEQQVKLAHDVGQFWTFAGEVLERMKQEPDGLGWMHEAIRKNAVDSSVVTDSYLHSMMMAIIVAAHETTAHAAANAVKLLLTHREAWEDICADPRLIPNAAEECLRYAGSVVAWRRRTTRAVTLGGVDLPEGANLLIVTASGNHDDGHFAAADDFDIYRGNAVDHLTFGYGSHQCLGKNLARMELRIILEELTRRLPHMQLDPDQVFTYLPNTSFRGPDHLWVTWDVAKNPEADDPDRLTPRMSYPVGPPERREIARSLRVAKVWPAADGILGLRLAEASGRPLPAWEPGAHVDLHVDGFDRKYSLCGAPGADTYDIAILREDAGRGGSVHLHKALREGATLRMSGPHCHFRVDPEAPHHTLIAGGIGITPILAMADHLRATGRAYNLHYCGRARERMAFLDRLARDHGDHLTLHISGEDTRADLAALVSQRPEGGVIHACGPDAMILALEALTADALDGTLHVEHFTTDADAAQGHGDPFTVDLADSGLTLTVGADQSLLQALRAAGVDVPSDCEEGLCGTCECSVLAGDPDHRDRVLTRAERDAGDRIVTCCSRARGGTRLRLAL